MRALQQVWVCASLQHKRVYICLSSQLMLFSPRQQSQWGLLNMFCPRDIISAASSNATQTIFIHPTNHTMGTYTYGNSVKHLSA